MDEEVNENDMKNSESKKEEAISNKIDIQELEI